MNSTHDVADKSVPCCSGGHEKLIRRYAGSFVLLSLILAWAVHPGWLGLAAFVGLNLLQSSFTGICPADNMIEWRHRRFGVRG